MVTGIRLLDDENVTRHRNLYRLRELTLTWEMYRQEVGLRRRSRALPANRDIVHYRRNTMRRFGLPSILVIVLIILLIMWLL